VTIDGGDVHLSEIVSSSDTPDFEFVSFTDIHLPDGKYTVSVTAVNGVQMQSQRKQTELYVLTTEPQTTGRLRKDNVELTCINLLSFYVYHFNI